ncbi:MAG TPA: gluconokinase [Pseudonocardiaceae bacterium]|jgi:gluconokinase
MTGDLRVVVMGPSGAGKSTIGALLAERAGLPFVDGDALHPASNVAKMAAGQPLDDADRAPWLDAVGETLRTGPVVVACSALRRGYRDRIRALAPSAVFVELRTDRAELERRMGTRAHFMPVALLRSQLDTLEPLEPDEPGFAVDTEASVEEVVDRCIAALTR